MLLDRVHLVSAALACCGLFAVAGCSRSSDGSVEISYNYSMYKMPQMTGWFKRRPAPQETAPADFPAVPPPPATNALSARQPAPAPARKARPRPRTVQPAVQPAAILAAPDPGPAAAMACRNVTQPGGRVKYVCE